MPASRLRLPLSALIAASLACNLLPGEATPSPSPTLPPRAPTADYGDAEDPAFPSLFASDGARTLDITQFWLGSLDDPSVTAEEDARVVDRDELDDGLERLAVRGGAASLAFRAVKSRAATAGTVYFNLLADLDGNGEWQGVSEWVVANRSVPLPPGGSELIEAELPLRPGAEIWIRASLTDMPVDEQAFRDGWDGTGEFAVGEVEDYRFAAPPDEPPVTEPPWTPTPSPTPTLTPTPRRITSEAPTLTPSPPPRVVVTGDFYPVCDPDPAIVAHGEIAEVAIRITSGDSLPDRYTTWVVSAPANGNDSLAGPEGEAAWQPWREGAGFTFASRDVDGPDRLEGFVIGVTLQNRSTTRFILCRILVEHKAGDARILDPAGDGLDFITGSPLPVPRIVDIQSLDLRTEPDGRLAFTFDLAAAPDPTSLGNQRLTYKIGIQIADQKGGYGQGIPAVEGVPPGKPPMRWHYGVAVDCNAGGCRGVLFRAQQGAFYEWGELEIRTEGDRVTVLVPLEQIGRPAEFDWVGIAVVAGGREDAPTDRVPDSGFETYAGP